MQTHYLSVYEKSMPESLTFGEKLRTAVKAGFNGVEISVDETDAKLERVLNKATGKAIISEIRAAEIPVKTMCLSGQRKYPFGSRDKKTREKSFDIIKGAIDFSYDAGLRIIQLAGYDVYYEESGPDTEEMFIEGLRFAAEYAAQAGVLLGFETMETPFMNTAEKSMRFVKLINSPYLKVYPDLGNIRNGTDNYINDLKSAEGNILAIHVKDTKEGIYRNLRLGEGRVDFVNCFAELLRQKVGIFNCEIWYDGKSDPVDFLSSNRKFAEDCLEKAERIIAL